MIEFFDELRVALRQWRRRPLVPTTIVLTLTAGLGAAIAVFAVMWAVMWRPLATAAPGELVWIEARSQRETSQSSPGAFSAWQTEASAFKALAAIRPVSGAVSDANGTDRVRGALVTESLFGVMAIQPIVGRAFTALDAQPGAPRTLLISSRLWKSRYGAANIVGQPISLNGGAATIIGVLPAIADIVAPEAEWWSPLALDAKDRGNTGPRYLDIIGRLAPGVTLDGGQEQLERIASTLTLRDDDGSSLGVSVTPFMHHLTAPYVSGLGLLFVGVLGLVLIASVNAAALLLTRAGDRATEMAIRTSVGASGLRLARQLFLETALLAALACAGGLVAALWVTDLLRAFLPAEIPRLAEARIDLPAALFALGLGGIVAMLAGVMPALRGTRADLQSMLRATQSGGPADDRLRQVFVVAQVAMAVVLSCSAALLLRSAHALDAAPRGYNASGVFTASITLPSATYRDASTIVSTMDRIIGGIEAVPGVARASASSQLPFAGGSPGADLALAEDAFTTGVNRQVRIRLVAPEYLNTLGVRLLEGRDIAHADAATSQPVLVVNKTLARRLDSTKSILGRAVKFDLPTFSGEDGKKRWTIVGVAEDSWDRGPREAIEPEVLLPLTQTPAEVYFWISRELQLAVRTPGDANALAPAVRRAVVAVDPGIPIGAARTLEDRIDAAFSRERMIARLLSVLSFAGFLVGSLGLGAAVATQVRRRQRETAIRLALGSTPTGVVRPIVAGGARLALAGTVIGTAASLGLTPLIGSLLFGITPSDPLTLAMVSLIALAISTLTAWGIARTAARVDPAELLRS